MSSKLQVVDQVNRWITCPRDPEDSWSHDSTAQSHNITGIKVIEDGYFDVETNLDVNWEDDYWLVSIVYTTCDTFGSYGGQIEHVDLFKSHDLAQALADEIKANAEGYGNRSSWNTTDIIYKIDNGEERTISGCWLGYFEHIESIEVTRVKRA